MSTEPVYVVSIGITKSDVVEIIDTLNKWEFDGEDEKELTYEEVMENPELLKYLVEQDYKSLLFFDLSECWNADGWGDIADYRK